MNAFMTNGTLDFLQKLNDKYPTIDFFLMNSGTSTLAYYEDHKKKVFSAGRAYEVLSQSGTLQEKGYVVMNNIPVTDDGKAMFESKFKQREKEVDGMPGFQAFRLLRPKKGNTYVVLTQWRTEGDFDNWKNSKKFKETHKNQDTKPPAYFADRPFVTSYHMFDPDKI
ncbi:antibiotic biosynthesis monooxygenase family protein [Virgibacillus byunsanensis]|uniref:Antibiotic biosynthesis monooxygenase family protein n=1 Tax=Virgibacillus byunsanensis TaxID=570945 RepID=A0ABW3LH29_9BACI